jgi:Uma2 family endonuclease
VQNSFGAVDDSEPKPDFTLLRRRLSQGDEAIPAGEDVFVGFEVSDTTLAYDRNVKLPPYAETGIPEAWIVDLEGKKIEVHSEPSAEGDKAMRLFVAGEEALSTAIEGLSVPVDEVMA